MFSAQTQHADSTRENMCGIYTQCNLEEHRAATFCLRGDVAAEMAQFINKDLTYASSLTT